MEIDGKEDDDLRGRSDGDDAYDDDDGDGGTSIVGKYAVQKTDGIMFQTIGNYSYHNGKHFTQGLTYSRSSDMLFESNGIYGKSSVCRLDPATGEALKCVNMKREYFAEGMQVYGKAGEEKLIQITWKEKIGFIYDATTLDVIGNFTFTTAKNEGWGICYDEDNHEFIVSDGSEYLHFWDADSLEEKRRVAVTRQGGREARNINELEFVNGKVLANVWYEDVILVIDPKSGECESEYGECSWVASYLYSIALSTFVRRLTYPSIFV